MPLKTRGRGRRGRPKKHERRNTHHGQSEADLNPVSGASIGHVDPNGTSKVLTTTATRPREELSFRDYFPDLNIKEPLPIVKVQAANSSTDSSVATNESASTAQGEGRDTPARSRQSSSRRESSSGSSGKLSSSGSGANSDLEGEAKDAKEGEEQATAPSSDEFDAGSSELSSISMTEEEEQPTTAESGKETTRSNGLVEYRKEGDTFQALSTRPQFHPAPPDQNTMGQLLDVNMDILPKPSFRKITDKHEQGDEVRALPGDESGEHSTEHSQKYQRPENHYIRYIEPSEADLFETIEYDMDEQDEAWLQMLNEERRKENLGDVSADTFEAVIDMLEKEWFDLVKNLPKQLSNEPTLPEDSACAICDDTECENSNAIVFCDGCNLAVHQDCYGIPYIPEGQWLCRKCLVSPENPVSCIFCPNEGGAFKQTNTNKWGHLLCAIWIPEVGLSNSVYMEPIDNIENIPKSRWKLTCYICRRRQGACIQCDNKHCFLAFHVTCARRARLCMRMKSHSSHYDGVVFKAYCDKHTPRDYREQVDVEQSVMALQSLFAKSARRAKNSHNRSTSRDHHNNDIFDLESLISSGSDIDENDYNRRKNTKKKRQKHSVNANAVTQLLPSSKAARAHQHHYSAGAPIAPEGIIAKLDNLRCIRQATNLRKKGQLLTSICRYWSLKRESRRGAPLLKRLHLEPWTASSSQHKQSEVEKAYRASVMMNLRADLERVRMLSEQVQKREKQKLERIRKQKAYLEMILFPLEYIVQPVVDQLIEADKRGFFRYPVTPDVAADYADVIKTPMSFQDILEKLARHEYSTIDEVEDDIMLIWKNSMTYNQPETMYYRLAEKLQKQSRELLAQARRDYDSLELKPETGILAVDIHPEIFTYNTVKVPTPEELVAEKERKEAEERARAEEAERQRQAAEKAEQKQAAQAERRRTRTAAVEEKRRKKQRAAAAAVQARREKQRRVEAEAEIAKAAEQAVTVQENEAQEEISENEEAPAKPDTANETEPNKDQAATGVGAGKVPPTAEPIVAEESGRDSTVSAEAAPVDAATKRKERTPKDMRRRTRSMGSEGLVAPTPEQLQKRSSAEARRLLWYSNTTPAAPITYKPDRKRKAPPGWLYIEDEDDESDTDDEELQEPPPPKRARKEKGVYAAGSKYITPSSIENKQVVWARVPGFPPHPAMVVDPTQEEVAPHILSAQPKNADVLVEFYKVPEKHKWGWVAKTDVYVFGDEAQDTEMLLLARKTKKHARIKESREGYQFACEILGLNPEHALKASIRKTKK